MNETVLAAKAAIAAFFAAVGMLIGWKGIMVLAWVFLMALDYLTGTWAAMKAGEWCSRKAREGAWHKLGAIVVIVVSVIADGVMLVICGNLPMLNITWPGTILPLMLAWYILTELGSILENAIKLGANPPAWLVSILKASANLVERAGDHITDGDTEDHNEVAADEVRLE